MHPRDFQKQYEDKQFGFDVAINLLKDNKRVARRGWNGKGMWVEYRNGDQDFDAIHAVVVNYRPYLLMKTADDEATFVPWTISQSDALADDWVVVW